MTGPVTCKRCLLRELSQESFASIYQYIESIAPELKAPEDEYGRRLAACQGCGDLVNGMCRHCGCFVEVRAAKAHSRCPGVPARW